MPRDPKYNWVDEGMVLRSFQDKDDWNAIDANLVVENEDSVWLNWGSFWGGIKMRRLDPATGKLSEKDTTLYSLCSRPREQPIGGSVEAPFIVRHDGYWYLFVSYDRCCRGVNSTYNVVVGRARRITGPYLDQGRQADDRGRRHAGHRGAPRRTGAVPAMRRCCRSPGQDYLVFHAYHGTTGRPSCRFRRWPGRTAGRAWAHCRSRHARLSSSQSAR